MTTITIDNEPRAYAWGIPWGIEQVRGRAPITVRTPQPVQADAPQAELWFGVHPSWPSVVTRRHSAGETLIEYLQEHDDAAAPRVLLKILAIQKPLSVQAHPDPEQARLGFDRENAAHVALDAKARNYKDPNAKPEMVYALSDRFELCAGFRPIQDIIADIQAIATLSEVKNGMRDEFFSGLLERLGAQEEGLESAVRWLFADSSAKAQRGTELLVQALEDPEDDPGITPERAQLVRHLEQHFPGDQGVFLSLLLNYRVLRRGEAAFLPPRTLHFYVSGVGAELMGPSDNVLRAGLTPKHIDTAELLRIIGYEPSEPVLLRPRADGAFEDFHPEGTQLHLRVATVQPGQQVTAEVPAGAVGFTLGAQVLGQTGRVVAEPGEGIYAPASESLQVRAAGSDAARLFVATGE